jgi:predicted secreted acid phosphatase
MFYLKQFICTRLLSVTLLLGVGILNGLVASAYQPLQTTEPSTVKLLVEQKQVTSTLDAQPLPNSLRLGLYQSFQLPHQQQLRNVYQQAETIISHHVATHPSKSIGWVVLDLDETVLDNRAYFILYGAYQPILWKQWLQAGSAPAIAGSIEFIQFLSQHKIPFAFLSGRREAQRASTLQNLTLLGLPTTVPILLKANDFPENKTAVAFKQEHRCQLEIQSGVKVWLLIGDQHSDLIGDCRGIHQFKLPNPIYTVD